MVAAAVLEDHEGGGTVRLVAGGHVDPPVARGAGVKLRLQRGHLNELTGGHAGLRGMVGRGLETVGGEQAGGQGEREE